MCTALHSPEPCCVSQWSVLPGKARGAVMKWQLGWDWRRQEAAKSQEGPQEPPEPGFGGLGGLPLTAPFGSGGLLCGPGVPSCDCPYTLSHSPAVFLFYWEVLHFRSLGFLGDLDSLFHQPFPSCFLIIYTFTQR